MSCECGCGQQTKVATQSSTRRGWVNGQPVRFLPYHHVRMEHKTPVDVRFWAKVNKTETCWLWVGAVTDNGYGNFRKKRKSIPAHRVSYELLIGPIPDGLELDHLCRVRNCVNPEHLEPVTRQENVKRGVGWAGENGNAGARKRRTHCNQGHEFTPENTGIRSDGEGRLCKKCKATVNRRVYLAQKNRALDSQQAGGG